MSQEQKTETVATEDLFCPTALAAARVYAADVMRARFEKKKKDAMDAQVAALERGKDEIQLQVAICNKTICLPTATESSALDDGVMEATKDWLKQHGLRYFNVGVTSYKLLLYVNYDAFLKPDKQ